MKQNQLETGKYYKAVDYGANKTNDFIFLYNEDLGHCPYISTDTNNITKIQFDLGGSFVHHNKFKLATKREAEWLNYCIAHNKYISLKGYLLTTIKKPNPQLKKLIETYLT